MPGITSVFAYCNNEIAQIVWSADAPIPGCLGFDVMRVYLNADGSVAHRPDGSEDRKRCAAFVAFKGQSNPHWINHDTGLWPIQKYSWRDLTLRKRRDRMARRPDETHVRYEIRPLGDMEPGLEPAPDPTPRKVTVNKLDDKGNPVLGPNGKPLRETVDSYHGKPRPLGYLGPAVSSNPVSVTRRRGPFQTAFTNGILAGQWLRNVLLADGEIGPTELSDKISDPNDPHRKYLAGDLLPMVRELFGRPGRFLLALYELEDRELLDLILANKDRLRIILSNTGKGEGGLWDARNHEARKALVEAGVDITHRLFNNNQIGHNKFVVHIAPDDTPTAVFTGSTNWTSTGFAGQTNNALLIENGDVAEIFRGYWNRMLADPIPVPDPWGAPMKGNVQGKDFRHDNAERIADVDLGGGAKLTTWFSPNMKGRSKGKATPPDLEDVYRRMRLARDAIFFLAFYPGQSGNDCIIGEAVDIAAKDPKLLLTGTVSSPNAMPNYIPKQKGDDPGPEDDVPAVSPYLYFTGNTRIVRAARIDDREVIGDFGGEWLNSKSAAGAFGAIVHDKIVVIDPLSDNCQVILGSHNLGFKASYANDENLVIVTGDRALAEAYMVHVLDVFDHYRFRAKQADLKKAHKKTWAGFLETTDAWQAGHLDDHRNPVETYLARGPA